MKTYLKKSITLAAAAMMAAAAMAGCNGGNGNSSQSSAPSSSQSGSSSSSSSQSGGGSGELATLRVLAPESTNTFVKMADRDKYTVWHELEKRLADHGVVLDIELINNEQYQVVIQTRMASANDLPDFANISALDTTTALNLASQGMLLPINEILTHGDGSAQTFLDTQVPFVKGACTAADGNMYWIPGVTQRTTYGGKPGSTCMMMTIRQDWLDMVNMEEPTTAEEFVSVVKAFQDQDVNGSGVADEIIACDASGFSNGIAQWFGLGPNLVSINLSDEEVVSPWYQPGIKDYFAYMNRLLNEGILDASLVGGNAGDLENQKMAENKIAGTFTYAMQAWLEPSVNADTEVYYQPIAALKAVDGIEPSIGIEAAEYIGGRYAFTKACTNLEAAAGFLDTMFTEDGMEINTWGIEGNTFEWVDGERKLLPNIDNGHWEDCANNDTLLGSWLFGDTVTSRIRFAAMEDEIEQRGGGKAEFQIRIIDHDPRYPFSNESYQAQPTQEQLERKSQLRTDLDTYSKELATQLVLGQKSLDDWDTYMAELKELGLDEMLEIDADMYKRFLDAQK